MRRKDYIMIARIFKPLRKNKTVVAIIEAFDVMFNADNPKYKTNKFKRACGL